MGEKLPSPCFQIVPADQVQALRDPLYGRRAQSAPSLGGGEGGGGVPAAGGGSARAGGAGAAAVPVPQTKAEDPSAS